MPTMNRSEVGPDAVVAVAEADSSMHLYRLMPVDVPHDLTIEALLRAIARRAVRVAVLVDVDA